MKLKKWRISRFWRRIRIRRKYKDRLFQKVFEDRKDLLELYNARNGTHYTNPEELEITTLEDVIYLSMKKGYELDEAINIAMDVCIKMNVLADILLKCRSEVFNMLLTEYDEKKQRIYLKREGHEEGREEAIEQINQLNLILAEQGRMDDIIKAAKDKEYQEKLFKEFGI